MSGNSKSSLRRAFIVFVLAWIGLAILAGPKALRRSSSNNHFSHLAQSWLDGRLSLGKNPPGFCSPEDRRSKKCRQHTFDDWARVWSVKTKDGQFFRGFPCKTKECTDRKRKERVDTWLLTGPGSKEIQLPVGNIEQRVGTWYVSFPPGPAFIFLPFVWIWGLAFWDVLFTTLIGALIPAALVYHLDRQHPETARRPINLAIALAWAFATPACFLATHGSVWFTAQIFAALFIFLFLFAAHQAQRPFLAGIWLGLAMSCRPHLALAALYFLHQQWTYSSVAGNNDSIKSRIACSLQPILKFSIPVIGIGLALGLHNLLRFDDFFEFGHRYLEVRWQDRIQSIGLFSPEYLLRNLRCAFSLSPVATDRFPYFKVSLHGSNILLGASWVFALAVLRKAKNKNSSEGASSQTIALILIASVLALPALFYQNSGQLQFSYRFAVDWLPLFIVAFASKGTLRHWKFVVLPLILFSALYQCTGAYYFGRKPGHIFVTQPLGWPFEDELR